MSRQLKFNYKEGRKIWFELQNGHQYEGTFVESDNYRIKVSSTTQLPEKKVVPGYTHFYKKEIFIIHELENAENNISDTDDEEQSIIKPDIQFDDFQYWTKNSKVWSYISVLNEDFDNCLDSLRNHDLIAVNGIGHAGRKHKICLLALATKFQVYVMNISVCGSETFDKGIRQILQSKRVCKIIFNGALLNDCLFHVHNVKLCNFFDLQVADKVISKDEKPMRKLSTLLVEYIQMPKADAKEVDDFKLELFLQNSIDKTVLRCAVKSVAYFIPLKSILEGIMLKDFQFKNNYCLNRTRDKSPISSLISSKQVLEELENLNLNS